MGEGFQGMHPDATVNVIEESWDNIHDKLVTDLAAGSYVYDVMMVPADMLPEFVGAGWLSPLTDEQVAEISEGNIALNIADLEGQIWGAPLTAYPQLMIYNKLILDEAGVSEPPKTWDEFVEVCQAVQGAGHDYCMLLALKAGRYAPSRFEVFSYGFGGQIVDDSGNVVFSEDPQVEAAVQFISDGLNEYKFIDPASLVTDDFEADTAFAQGRYAFHVSSAWGFFQADHNPDMSNIMGDAHVMLMPTTAEGLGGGTRSYGAVLAIPTTSENPELAWEFIKYMVSGEGQRRQLFDTGNLPVYDYIFRADDVVSDITDIAIMGEQIGKGTATLPYRWEPEYERILAPYLQEAWLGQKGVPEALSEAAADVSEIAE
jgi:ABC-type glycerol-3-phosphate transport system substrate-binding protein